MPPCSFIRSQLACALFLLAGMGSSFSCDLERRLRSEETTSSPVSSVVPPAVNLLAENKPLRETAPSPASSSVVAAMGGDAAAEASIGPKPAPVPAQRAATHGQTELRAVRPYAGQDFARVTLHLSNAATYKTGSVRDVDGQRVFVDLENVKYDGKYRMPVGGALKRVRLGARPDGTRVVLDIAHDMEFRTLVLPEPFRIVVDVFRPRRAEGPKLVPIEQISRIVLDPGHGGRDPGATGPGGLEEKEVALDVAHRAAPLLAREVGVNVLLTRDADYYVPLGERVAKANDYSADLFISIHCNASLRVESHGVMTFVLDESQDSGAHEVAARENDSSVAAVTHFAASIRRDIDPAVLRRARRFGRLLQKAAVGGLRPFYPDLHDGGVRSAGFYVLAGAQMPAVVFEASFISNSREEQRLGTETYRQRLADALVNAVRALRAGY